MSPIVKPVNLTTTVLEQIVNLIRGLLTGTSVETGEREITEQQGIMIGNIINNRVLTKVFILQARKNTSTITLAKIKTLDYSGP